jgi:hypothetical protein
MISSGILLYKRYRLREREKGGGRVRDGREGEGKKRKGGRDRESGGRDREREEGVKRERERLA